ncbi:uncharacterized protein N7484_007948 [Penicillium longicatenatum]|uniref:uncharacterized protein n=1 Tax=Penicillium longicatenatum TaxID=1561947 RepID=UPI0025490C0E|nr:uncharacterized protein N7484_007948 [Penicillium longicatenatum]KAJ5640086.1 hypothetical protein N7484_007948 [Penicillium longicatenatum]
MKCTFEWMVTENDGSSALVKRASAELSFPTDVDNAARSDITENTSDYAVSGRRAVKRNTPDGDSPVIAAPESTHTDDSELQNSIRDIDISEAKDSNSSAPENISSERDLPDDNTPDITAPGIGDLESSGPENISTQKSTADIDITEISDSRNSVPDKNIPGNDTSSNSTHIVHDTTIEVVVQEPSLCPTMATFEAPYDSPTPSSTSTRSSSSKSSSAASNVSTNSIPPPPLPPQNLTTPSNSAPSSISSSSDSEDPQDPTSEPILKPVENPTEEGMLETAPAITEADLISSLHLIADSIAQQRQMASKSIIHSGFYWSILVIIFEYLYRILWHTPADWIMILLLWVCSVIATLSGIKIWTSGYLDEAERVGRWSWLFGGKWASNFDGEREDDAFAPLRWTLCQGVWFRVSGGHVEKALAWCAMKRNMKKKEVLRQRSLGGVCDVGKAWEEYSAGTSANDDASAGLEIDVRKESLKEGWMQDKVFVSRFNGRVIATLVIRTVPVDTDSVVTVPRNEYDSDSEVDSDGYCHLSHLKPTSQPEKVVIRAWTVMQKYRGFGVGLGILQFAIEYALELGLQGPEFAVDHTNSLRALPKLFNGNMDRDDKRARDRLAKEIRKCVTGKQGNEKKV